MTPHVDLSVGLDGCLEALFKVITPWVAALLNLFHSFFSWRTVPSLWKPGILVPNIKQHDPLTTCNFRMTSRIMLFQSPHLHGALPASLFTYPRMWERCPWKHMRQLRSDSRTFRAWVPPRGSKQKKQPFDGQFGPHPHSSCGFHGKCNALESIARPQCLISTIPHLGLTSMNPHP